MSETYSYEVLEPGGHARLVGNVLDRISRASANPASAVGSSSAMLGDAETASWMERTTAADGAALIESICGNTVVESGSLLPVRMTGVETNGFNQWDEQTADGYWNDDGTMTVSSAFICCKNKIPVFPGQTYYIQRPSANINIYTRGYDADGINGISLSLPGTNLLAIPDGIYFIAFAVQKSQYGSTYNNDICINLSDPARNGTYEPYWSSQRTIPAVTYFPDGMRSAGSVYDELTETQAITRVGAYTFTGDETVDISNWRPTEGTYACLFPLIIPDRKTYAPGVVPNAVMVGLDADSYSNIYGGSIGFTMSSALDELRYSFIIRVPTSIASTNTELLAWLAGKTLYYELATPTTQPIDPPLAMSYRTGAGGTERVMVASGTTSAPPIFVTRYPLTPEDIRDRIAATVAPVEQVTAQANHAIGELVYLGWSLYKVTSAIATGETITPGTNVTETTVAAELAALSE